MAYVPGCASDLFISYARRDDEAPLGQSAGWVTLFHDRLAIKISQALGETAEVSRDCTLGGATMFTPELERRVRGAAVLVAIVSPSYQNSNWCRWELENFELWGRQQNLLQVGTRSRAIKVLKTALPQEAERQIVPGTAGFQFWYRDKQSKYAYEYKVDSAEYEGQIDRLAQEIAAILQAMRQARTAYFGHAPASLEAQRELVVREVTARGYRVVSASPRADGAAADEAAISSALQAAGLSVHFADGAEVVETGDATLEQVELRLAAGLNIRRVVSAQLSAPAPGGLEPLLGGADQAEQADVLLNKKAEYVKEVVLDRLGSASKSSEPPRSGELVRVYLMCDQPDHPYVVRDNHALSVHDYLNEEGFEVRVPLADVGPSPTFSRDNREKLKECDGVLLYWGSAKQAWFDEKVRELKQALGWRRSKPFRSKAGYLSCPENLVKQRYRVLELDEFVREFGEFSRQPLRGFVQKLRGGTGGGG